MYTDFQELPSVFLRGDVVKDLSTLERKPALPTSKSASKPASKKSLQPSQPLQLPQSAKPSFKNRVVDPRKEFALYQRKQSLLKILKALEQADRTIKIYAPNLGCPLLTSKLVAKLLHQFACRRERTQIQILLNEVSFNDIRKSPLVRVAKRHVSKVDIRQAAIAEPHLKSMYVIIDYRKTLCFDDYSKLEESRYLEDVTRNRMLRESFDPAWQSSRYVHELKSF